jgi:hypothetical protein
MNMFSTKFSLTRFTIILCGTTTKATTRYCRQTLHPVLVKNEIFVLFIDVISGK